MTGARRVACVVGQFLTTAQACEIERNVAVEANDLILQHDWRGAVLVVKTECTFEEPR